MAPRTPFYHVTLEGEDITGWVSAVSAMEDDKQADSVAITIPDPRMIYADALFEGSVAEVDLGYAEANQHALVLRAILTQVELNYPESGVPTVTLKGADRSILMGLVEKRKLWRNQSVTDIVRAIARANGFTRIEAQLDPDPRIESRPLNQDGKTDLAFLQELADTYHAKCFVELDENGAEVFYFLPERRIVRLRRPEQLVLRYRMGVDSNLISFGPSFDSSYIDRLHEIEDLDREGRSVSTPEQPLAEVTLWRLDPQRMAQLSPADRTKLERLYQFGTERKQDLQKKLSARRPTVGVVVADAADLDARSDTLESRRLGMSASGTSFGNIWLRAKSHVQIDGAGERWNGEWYVSSVTHKIDSSGFRTDFKAVR